MPMELIDWFLRIVMIAAMIGIFLWGRAQKQSDDLLTEKLTAMRHTVIDQAQAQDKTLLLQLAVRDQQLLGIHTRLDQAGIKASDIADRIMVKIGDIDHRITVIETRLQRTP